MRFESLDIAALQAFIAVARDGSFSKASERLFITQPAVSKRVAALETELGVALFNRIARTVSLTEAGKQLLLKAQELVDQADELQKYASNLNDDISGNLSVSIAHHIGLYRMQPILREYNERYPKVSLDIRFQDSDQAIEAVEQGDIEFAVITLPSVIPENLKEEVIWRDELRFVVAKEHPLATKASTHLDDLAQYCCVLTSRETETHKIVQRLFDAGDLTMQVQMQTNSLETLKMLAGAGIGWSVLPVTMLREGVLAQLKVEQPMHRSLGIVSHSRRYLSNAASALQALIRAAKD